MHTIIWEKLMCEPENNNEYEKVESVIYRHWVPGGWLVRDSMQLPNTKYIPDVNHEWQAKGGK